VAEIIAYFSPEPADKGDEWLDGKIYWRGVMVPVVSIESMCLGKPVETGARSRIAVIYHPDGDDDLPYIGLILTDIPQAYLAEENKMQSLMIANECEFINGQMEQVDEKIVLPNIEAIAAAIKLKLKSG